MNLDAKNVPDFHFLIDLLTTVPANLIKSKRYWKMQRLEIFSEKR